MKCFRRYFSVLLCCVLLFLGCSVTASADTVDVPPYVINMRASLKEKDTNSLWYTYFVEGFDPKNSEVQEYHYTPTVTGLVQNNYIQNTWEFVSTNGEPFFKEGGEITYLFLKAQANVLLQYRDKNGNVLKNNYDRNLSDCRLLLFYVDGSTEYVNDVVHSVVNTNQSTFEVKFTPKQDVMGFSLISFNTFAAQDFSYNDVVYNIYMGDYFNTNLGWQLSISQDSKEVGLLGGIIEWIKSIFNKIGNIFDSVTQGFSNIGTWFSNLGDNLSSWFSNLVNNIIQLPSKIWNLMSEGLKSLFVPDEEYMTDYSDRWDELLSSRFGAIYQVGTIITDFAERIEVSDKTNTITIPEVNLNSVGIPFSFGGYNVQIVPNGFNFIVETLKIIVSIVCTFMFVNGLRKRYDEVMGVKQ